MCCMVAMSIYHAVIKKKLLVSQYGVLKDKMVGKVCVES